MSVNVDAGGDGVLTDGVLSDSVLSDNDGHGTAAVTYELEEGELVSDDEPVAAAEDGQDGHGYRAGTIRRRRSWNRDRYRSRSRSTGSTVCSARAVPTDDGGDDAELRYRRDRRARFSAGPADDSPERPRQPRHRNPSPVDDRRRDRGRDRRHRDRVTPSTSSGDDWRAYYESGRIIGLSSSAGGGWREFYASGGWGHGFSKYSYWSN